MTGDTTLQPRSSWQHHFCLSDLRTLLGYAGYLTAQLIFIVMLPLLVLLLPFARIRTKVIGGIFHTAMVVLTRKFLCALGIYRIVEISGLEHLAAHRPAVVVANHRSRIDAPVLLGFVRNCGVLIKEHYARLPLYASFVKHLDFVSVQPGNLSSLQRALEQSRSLAGRGKSLIVFPEGTRAPGPRLRPFQDIAFRIAQHNTIPVIAAIIHTSAPFMSVRRGSTFPPLPMKMTIRFLPPFYPQTTERSSQFAARVQQQIAAHLRELDKGTAWEHTATPSLRTMP